MKRILVPTDFSATSRLTVVHALEVSDAVEAELLLLHVVDEETLAGAQLIGIREVFTMTIDPSGNAFCRELPHQADYQVLCEEAEWKLAALLPPLDSGRLRTQVVVGRVADEIVRVAIDERAHLIIMGIQGKKGWWRMRLGSVAERVIQKSPVPVMTLWVPRSASADRMRGRNLTLSDREGAAS
jgi:nucleotide-binding universal stress UspA family protein